MTRRRSVASISPQTSPSERSPPNKKPLLSFQPSFTIRVPQQPSLHEENTGFDEDVVFTGLESAVIKAWTTLYPDILSATFEKNTWKSHFERLGIEVDVISMISSRIDVLESVFSSVVVWTVLNTEAVGTVAQWVLETEVAEYSYKRLRYTRP